MEKDKQNGDGSAELQANLSVSTLRRLSKKHFRHYKPPTSINDYCIYCLDLKQQVIPDAPWLESVLLCFVSLLLLHGLPKPTQFCIWAQVDRLYIKVRSDLTNFMANYFELWDTYEAAAGFSDLPGQRLREFQHFISHHADRQPCSRHRGSNFPCGLSSFRGRGSGFPQRRRVELFAKEAEICVEVTSMSKLLDSYMAANKLQKPILMHILEKPSANHLVCLSDFKELVTLPIRSIQSGEEFFANARKELSVFGAILSEREGDRNSPVL